MISNSRKLFCLSLLLAVLVTACGGSQAGAGANPVPVDAPTVAVAVQPQRVGIGIGGLSYWDGSFAMADVGKQAQLRGMDWSYDVGADADGNPGRDFQLIYSSTKIGSGVYKLMFNGRALVTAGGAGSIQNATYDSASNSTKADLVIAGEPTGNVWLTFKDSYRTKGSVKGDGVTDIHLWRPGYPTDGSTTFTSEFVLAMKKFKTIRGMDFVSANTNAQAVWSERTKPNFFGLTGDSGQSWELLIALANAAERDVWLNVPVRADDDYIRKLAQLVKYGSDGILPYSSVQAKPVYAPLKAGLNVYVEYGNEVWNPGAGFRGFGWALALSNANKDDPKHPIAFDGAQPDQYLAFKRWIAYRSATISLAFRQVFGDGAMMSTVRPIFATQVGNANAYLSSGLIWAQQFYGQVRKTAPVNAVVRKPSEIWYGGGGAAYYEASIDPKDASAGTKDAYFASLPTPAFANSSVIDSIWTHAYGLKYVAYEGGPGPGGSSLGFVSGAALAPAFNNDLRMKDRMLIAQDIWDRVGGDELVYYVYSSSAPWSFSNELVQQVVSDTSSVKLKAVDAINAKARPAVTLGSLVPKVVYLKDPATETIGSNLAVWAQSGTTYLLRPGATDHVPYVMVPVRTAAAGTYRVSLNIAAKVSGSVALFVNGTSYGLIMLAPDASNTNTVSSKVAVALPAGLSVLRLDTPQGSGDIFVRDVVVE